MQTYYKAILYNNNEFEVKEVSDEEAYAKTSYVYTFRCGNSSGIFAIRETKSEAIDVIKEEIQEKYTKAKEAFLKLKNIIHNIESNYEIDNNN